MQDFVSNNLEVLGTAGANYTGSATTSDVISLKNYHRVAIKIYTYDWAGGTAAVTLKQATDVAATGAKALSFSYQYTNVSGSDDRLTQTAVTSNTFNLSAANKTHIIEIMGEDLDRANGFDCIRVDIASPGANNDFYSVHFTCYEPRYGSTAASLPSAIID